MTDLRPENGYILMEVWLDRLDGENGLVNGCDYGESGMAAAGFDPSTFFYMLNDYRGLGLPEGAPDFTLTLQATRFELAEPDWLTAAVKGMAQDHEWGLTGGRNDGAEVNFDRITTMPGTVPNPMTQPNPVTLPAPEPRGWDSE